MFTAPAGTSDVAESTSASSIAARGCVSDASAMTALPPTSTGAMREISPASAGSSGARTPTTPGRLGDSEIEVRTGDGVGAAEDRAGLVAQPAYQTTRSIARSTSFFPELRAANSSRRRLHHLGDAMRTLPARL